MKRNSYALLTIALMVVLLISSCASQPAEKLEVDESIEEAQGTATIMEVPLEDETDNDREDESITEEPQTQTSEPELLSVETPDWFDVTLVDVRTGQSFTMNDFYGKVVLVETLAAFEDYSARCESQSPADASMHAFLHAITARARWMMESALQRLVQFEGIQIESDTDRRGASRRIRR